LVTVEVAVTVDVEVSVSRKGWMTVKTPEGAPDAIRRVAVRVKVDVLVTVVVHGGGVGVGELPIPIAPVAPDIRHEHAEEMRSESNGAITESVLFQKRGVQSDQLPMEDGVGKGLG
jgi:hypothetical protein